MDVAAWLRGLGLNSAGALSRGTESLQTLCWRKPDSNPRSHHVRETGAFKDSGPRDEGMVARFTNFQYVPRGSPTAKVVAPMALFTLDEEHPR